MSTSQIFGCCLLIMAAVACATAGTMKRPDSSAAEPQQQLYCYEQHREQDKCVKCCDENYNLCKKELGCEKGNWRCQNPCWEYVKYCDYQCKL